jgi:hypothetical protein
MSKKSSIKKSILENAMKKIHLENSYEDWVKNFSQNLNNIWRESSARDLDPTKNSLIKKKKYSAIIIGAGPSIVKYNHLQMLADSDYKGTIICTDRSLVPSLKAGITPNKFPNYFVVTIDPAKIITKYYENKIIKEFGSKINGIFTTVTHPSTVDAARNMGIKIHWTHALFDYNEGKKSFNQMSALMVKTKKHYEGLPAIQTGGNVGTSCWFIAWQILRCDVIALLGINHSWDENDSWKTILSHSNAPQKIDKNNRLFKQLFPKVYNPEFDCYCILDPIFQYYSNALKEFILRSPITVKTINATEGGCIFGKRITCMKFSEFLRNYKN